MAYYNPMLKKLQKQIEQHNKEAESELEKVAFKQNIVTIITLVFNIFVFITETGVFDKVISEFKIKTLSSAIPLKNIEVNEEFNKWLDLFN